MSDFFAFLIGAVFGYRRKIVRKNLLSSFPDISHRDLRRITRDFYRNLTDVFLETFKLLTISKEQLVRRTRIKNLNVINERLKNGQSLIALTSHYCNWEWLLATCSIQFLSPPDAVYLRVKSPFFEKLMLRIRSRFGAYMIEKKYILSEANKRHDKVRVIALVADQAPKGERSLKWINFLNQETPFINGPERISKILNLPVVYGKMTRTGRGKYEIEFREIEPSADSEEKDLITEKFGKILEDTIRQCPHNWLWSHNRWKQSKPAMVNSSGA